MYAYSTEFFVFRILLSVDFTFVIWSMITDCDINRYLFIFILTSVLAFCSYLFIAKKMKIIQTVLLAPFLFATFSLISFYIASRCTSGDLGSVVLVLILPILAFLYGINVFFLSLIWFKGRKNLDFNLALKESKSLVYFMLMLLLLVTPVLVTEYSFSLDFFVGGFFFLALTFLPASVGCYISLFYLKKQRS